MVWPVIVAPRPAKYSSASAPDRLTATQRRDQMEIVEERYGRRSPIVTSQLPVETWHDVIGEPTFADAILDRLVYNAYRIPLDGPSLRKTGIDNHAEASQ
jgi:DNA replication protein DnaC